jgi:endonuclease G
MKKIIIMFCGLFTALGMAAQTQSYKTGTIEITLRDGAVITYTAEQFDSVRVLNGLNIGVKVYLKDAKSKDYLCKSVTVKSDTGGGGDTDNNTNRNKYRAKLLEYPHLNVDSVDNLLVIHSTDDYGITYSLEWDCTKKANRWSCYEMYDGNSLNNVGRSDAFAEDPEIPSAYRTTLSDYKNTGFSRGHLCPSADRLCSSEQNKQTFFLSNMQPQYQNHNGVLWANLEELVRNKWDTSTYRDTLYVVKAATIDNSDQILSHTTTGLIVPKYFYMAVLAIKDGKYKAIGLWTEHKNVTDTNKNYGDYAISIDELEKRTGIDFFCNLPDDIETQVESSFSLSDWNITKSN